MPKVTKSKKAGESRRSQSPYKLEIFTGDAQVLQLIVIAFLALSSLMILYVVKQQDEIRLYKSASAVNSAK